MNRVLSKMLAAGEPDDADKPALREVLVADDERTARLMLERVLSQIGYTVTCVDNGAAAMEFLRAAKEPVLAIIDWMMPGMSGPDICTQVRSEIQNVQPYIILLSSKDSQEDVISGLDAGANDYIKKPFERGELYARVRVGFRMLQLQRSLEQRIHELEEARYEIATLSGIVPICMCCHKIRDDADYWHRLEGYLQSHSNMKFSHGFCPDCLHKIYPEVDLSAGETEPLKPEKLSERIAEIQSSSIREEMDRKYKHGDDAG